MSNETYFDDVGGAREAFRVHCMHDGGHVAHTHLTCAMGRVTSVTILHPLDQFVCKRTTETKTAHLGTWSTSMKVQALPCCHVVPCYRAHWTRTLTHEKRWLGAPYFLARDNARGDFYGEPHRPLTSPPTYNCVFAPFTIFCLSGHPYTRSTPKHHNSVQHH